MGNENRHVANHLATADYFNQVFSCFHGVSWKHKLWLETAVIIKLAQFLGRILRVISLCAYVAASVFLSAVASEMEASLCCVCVRGIK